MLHNRFNFRLLFGSFVSLLDDAIILALVLIILSRFGIRTPTWLIVFIAVLFTGWTFASYVIIMNKNPQFGFENMIGATGLTLDSLSPKGTVKIGHEQWAAKARGGNIGTGIVVVVVSQTGLLLTVVRKDQMESTDSHR
jgi:membrane-bound ClpP family serine protease